MLALGSTGKASKIHDKYRYLGYTVRATLEVKPCQEAGRNVTEMFYTEGTKKSVETETREERKHYS
jgi:hypothetical protein